MRADVLRAGQHVMTVCNACRYCEQYCPVFPAMERRLTFTEADLHYLANLCHNCGECLHACQYAPPHEFGINVPRTMAEIRLESYEEYCWPRFLGWAFRDHSVVSAVGLALGFMGVILAAMMRYNPAALWREDASANFYAVVPHTVMVQLFGGVALFVLVAFGVGLYRFWRDVRVRVTHGSPIDGRHLPTTHAPTLRDVFTLRHLHGGGVDCTSGEERRSPWRRWMHHCTFYGFMLCFASTTVAALYHLSGFEAPYGYTSLPVMLGTTGGLGLLIGPAGLFALRMRRDPALADPAQAGMDDSFLFLLFLTSLTGLVLLAFRERAVMSVLLVVHLGAVLALFVTLPYGKFVHGIYRAAALVKFAGESKHDR